jgi:glutamate synthase domain-containing protein 3
VQPNALAEADRHGLENVANEPGRRLRMETNAEQIAVRAAVEIDAADVPYRELNTRLRNAVVSGAQKVVIRNAHGQRYIGANLGKPIEVEIQGTPGNEVGAFMDGLRIVVHGSVPDGCGDAMESGEIVVHGRAGDNLGLSARGGKIFVQDDAGRGAGIYMRESRNKKPVVVIGGTAQDFLAQHMAGGTLVLLGLTLKQGQAHSARSVGTGMHGGVIYVRGTIEDYQLDEEVGRADLDEDGLLELRQYVTEFAHHFGYSAEEILSEQFAKLVPLHVGPHLTLHAY